MKAGVQRPQVYTFLEMMNDLGLRLTYPEVRFESRYSEIMPSDAELDTKFSERVALRVPIVSAAMDTVTEADMAIALAEYGGIGVIHRGLTPKAQASAVDRVKHRQNGLIENPITVPETWSVTQLQSLRREKGYLFHRFPVLDGAGKLVGLVTRKDLDVCEDEHVSVSKIMTVAEDLETAPKGIGKREAYERMRNCKRESLPLINKDGTLAGLYLFEDLKRILLGHSTANVDSNDQLRVAAAVGTSEAEMERVALLLEKKCDVIVIDTAHGHTQSMRLMIEAIRREFGDVEIVAGNVSDPEAAVALANWGANGIKVGQGPGSICTTRVVAGIGVPQVSAVGNCARALREAGFERIPVIADGGMENSGDLVIALSFGASCGMFGGMLAGTDEAPGEIVYDPELKQVKKYRGMGSLSAMRDSRAARERYGQQDRAVQKLVAEGVEARVPYKGKVTLVLDKLSGGLRQGMGYLGARTIGELLHQARPFRVSPVGMRESGVHGVQAVAE
ncbi:MAG: IMP dehydrogenase [Candidatus Pacebacteria bacterium]|nr:IMP dehydrogenase [Candidatus Paceibacterota bacterium]